MNIKILYYISGVLGVLFIIVFIILASLNKVSFAFGISAGLVILLLVGLGDVIIWFVTSKRKVAETPTKKLMTMEEARKAATESLMTLDYLEYEKEILWEDIIGMGTKNTPVYIKLVRGEFENKLYGIIINLEEKKPGVKEYDDKKIHFEAIKNDLLYRANLASSAPKEERPMKEIRSLDPFTGREVYSKEPLPGEILKEEEKGVSLK